jgi:hypothetical protein
MRYYLLSYWSFFAFIFIAFTFARVFINSLIINKQNGTNYSPGKQPKMSEFMNWEMHFMVCFLSIWWFTYKEHKVEKVCVNVTTILSLICMIVIGAAIYVK